MEIFGGFMVMMSFTFLFLAVVWLIMPFVVFAIKGKQDRTLEVLETIEKRLAALESRLAPVVPDSPAGLGDVPADSKERPLNGGQDTSADETAAGEDRPGAASETYISGGNT